MWLIVKIAGYIVAWLPLSAICGGIGGWYMSKWQRSKEGREFNRAVTDLKCELLSIADEVFFRSVFRESE